MAGNNQTETWNIILLLKNKRKMHTVTFEFEMLGVFLFLICLIVIVVWIVLLCCRGWFIFLFSLKDFVTYCLEHSLRYHSSIPNNFEKCSFEINPYQREGIIWKSNSQIKNTITSNVPTLLWSKETLIFLRALIYLLLLEIKYIKEWNGRDVGKQKIGSFD